MEFFSRVSKMGDKLWVLIPIRDTPKFKPGDTVCVKKVESPFREGENG